MIKIANRIRQIIPQSIKFFIVDALTALLLFFNQYLKIKSIDIDYPPDFQLAEKILLSYDK